MGERLVRGAVEAFMARDLDGILARAAPEIERGSNVLYAHLGGQPALSAYAGLFR